MKESHIEGVAIHDDPESCAGSRKAGREVLTGAHTGSVLSREITMATNWRTTSGRRSRVPIVPTTTH
jgi:hypothetical protein